MSTYSAVRLAVLSLALFVHCQGFTVPSTPSIPSTSSARTTSTTTARQAHARRSHTITPKMDQKQDATVAVTSKKSTASPRKKFQFQRKNTSEQVDVTAQTMFHAIDTDGNGKIDAHEMREYLVSTGVYTEAVAKSIFERLDTSQKGHLQLKELQQGMQHHSLFGEKEVPNKQQVVVKDPQQTYVPIRNKQQPLQQRRNRNANQRVFQRRLSVEAQAFFEKLDANRDGFVSMKELKEHFMVQRMQAAAQSSGLFSEQPQEQPKQRTTSEDNKKAVPWHHSEAAIQKLFEVLDVNADGRISLQELRDAFVQSPTVRHVFQN